jgi:hypothetical protein
MLRGSGNCHDADPQGDEETGLTYWSCSETSASEQTPKKY